MREDHGTSNNIARGICLITITTGITRECVKRRYVYSMVSASGQPNNGSPISQTAQPYMCPTCKNWGALDLGLSLKCFSGVFARGPLFALGWIIWPRLRSEVVGSPVSVSTL
jgi:hypothetical protein